VTVEGIDWNLQPGIVLALGDEVIVRVTSYTVPCRQIAASFMDGNFMRISSGTSRRREALCARAANRGGWKSIKSSACSINRRTRAFHCICAAVKSDVKIVCEFVPANYARFC
jgi:hypothetical protein